MTGFVYAPMEPIRYESVECGGDVRWLNGKLTRGPLATLQLTFNGLTDQVQPGFPVFKGGIHGGNGFGGYREGQAVSPKFFTSHVTFSYVRY